MKSIRSFFLIPLVFVFLPFLAITQTIVRTQGKSILVNDTAYIIRGICYNPVAIGKGRFDPMDYTHIDQDILLMTQAKINTIRMYQPITNVTVLDKLAAAGIKVIVGFTNYDDTGLYPDINHGTYLGYINTYKTHPAILMWELGNEYNYHTEWFSNNINNWYTILNTTAGAIHAADPNHPVSTAHGEVPSSVVVSACPNVDVWGMNVYRYDDPSAAITQFNFLSSKPCYFSESGADRYNNTQGAENQQNQADGDLAIWNHISPHFDLCSGIAFFSFVDEWWKKGNNGLHDVTGTVGSIPYDHFANEEWWGIVDIYRNTTLAYDVIKNVYTQYAIGIQEIAPGNSALILPNPAEDKIIVRLSNTVYETIQLKIFGIAGNLLFSEEYEIHGNEIVIPLDRDRFTAGSYLLNATGKTVNINKILILK